MRYEHIINYVAQTPWAILPQKMEDILSFLAFKAAGGEYTAADIRARIGDGAQRPSRSPNGSIAIIPLRGVIAHRAGSLEESSGGMSAERFALAIRTLAADESVGTILIDGDSPGGTVPGVMEAAQAVYDARATTRVIAIANGALASAAYWIASQATEIVAIPSIFEGLIGSIGVFTAHRDLSGALEKEGIKIEFISAGKHKVDGHEFGPLSDAKRAEIQAMVNAAYDRFVKDVARGRGVTPASVRNGFGQGKALSAVDAKSAGLIDRIATMDDTLGQLVSGDRSVPRRLTASTQVRADFDLLSTTMALVASPAPAADRDAADRDALAIVAALTE